jgi:riboflavin kinase
MANMPSATESAEIRSHRPSVIGSDEGPKPEYPRRMEGVVEHGFKRGSKDVCAPLDLQHLFTSNAANE